MSNELKTYTLQELYAHPMEPISWLAEGLLAPGLYFLGGSPKVGKSWLALQLCLAVCRGEPFLGFRTRKSEVLYLALEDGPRRLHTRALRLTEEAPAGLHLCGHAPMIGQGLEQQLDQMLAEHPGIRLVIIDTLQKVRMVAGANASYGNDYQDAAALKELADRCNVCLLVIHHLRKMPDEDPFNRLSGTNGLTGAADGTIILIRQKRQEGTATLSATGRDIEDMELTLDFSDCHWSRSCSPDELQLMYLLPSIRQLLATGEFLGSATELVEKLGQQGTLWGPAQLSRYLQSHREALAEQGILLDTKRSNHKRFCRFAWQKMTRVTAMTLVTVGARHGMCRHNRHHRHCRHRRHNAGGMYMAYIQQRGERKYKITVCNGYTASGKKRMQARTIDVPKDIPKRSIQQYVYAEAERLEKRFRTGIDESENTRFEAYAEHWLDRAAKRYKASTLAGYRKMLEVAYPTIGGLPLCKIRPMVLEEFAEELRKRPGRGGKPLSENTVHKYLDAVSAVLQDAAKNDILLYNPAHRVEKVRVEKVQQRIPQQWEMQKLLQCILQEPLLYRVYYLMALSTGLRRGELCALRWCDLHGGNQVKIQHSRSTVVGQGVLESDTKNHRARIVVMPQIVFDELGELFTQQALENNGADWNGLIFQRKGKPVHPNTFSHHLRRLYDKNGFPEEYHLHTMRHFFATYLLEHGTSKQVAADLLGHADTAFLERTYCHPQDVCKEEAAGLFDSLLAPAEEEYYDALQD